MLVEPTQLWPGLQINTVLHFSLETRINNNTCVWLPGEQVNIYQTTAADSRKKYYLLRQTVLLSFFFGRCFSPDPLAARPTL